MEKLVLASVGLLVASIVSASVAPQDSATSVDGVLARLVAAKSTYEETLDRVSAALAAELASAEKDARDTVKRERLDKILADQTAFASQGAWPSSIWASKIKTEWEGARSTLRKAYQDATDVTFKLEDRGLEAALRAERDAFAATSDLAPWRPLWAAAEIGEGDGVWRRIGTALLAPAPTTSNGDPILVWFRVDLPREYVFDCHVELVEPTSALVIGFADADGRQRDHHLAEFASKAFHLRLLVLTNRIAIEIDGRQTALAPSDDLLVVDSSSEQAVLFLSAKAQVRVDRPSMKPLAPIRVEGPKEPTLAKKTAKKPEPPRATTGAGRSRSDLDKKRAEAATLAVRSGVDWLLRHQHADGSWRLEQFTARCADGARCASLAADLHDHYDVGLSSLCMRALVRAVAAGDELHRDPPTARALVARCDEAARKCGHWLAGIQKSDGRFTPDRWYVYNEVAALIALSEGMKTLNEESWRGSIERAVTALQSAQAPGTGERGQGGWRYWWVPPAAGESANGAAAAESDTSCTSWAMRALESAKLSGSTVSEESLERGAGFVKWATADGGLVGYIDARAAGSVVTGKNDHFKYHAGTMTAAATIARACAHAGDSDDFFSKAKVVLVRDPPSISTDRLSIDYYYWHHGVEAWTRFPAQPKGEVRKKSQSGSDRANWISAAVEALVSLQDRSENACEMGAWLASDRWAYAGGAIYCTALNVSTLEEALGWR